jgi:TIR domain
MAAGLESRLFISYAHDDNESFVSEQEGFVNRLHKALEVRLRMRGFRDVRIWMDREELKGNDVLAGELDGQVSNAAVLISVISPAYLTSDWCKRELREFCEAAEKTNGLLFGNKSRVFKIVKFPPEDEEELPPAVKGLVGYRFYTIGEDKTPRELDPVFGPESAQQYAIRVTSLAWDIAQLIKLLSAHPADVAQATDARHAKPAVYLAECAYDRWDDRESLAAELKMRGYAVLPENQLPRDEAGYAAEVARLLGGCRLSIHLAGSGYGLVPDGPGQRSVAVIQNDLAIERSRSAGLQRIIWLPEGTKSTNQAQQDFIDALLGDANAQFGADLITGNFESLKETVRAALHKIEAPEPAKPAAARRLVYIICDQRDREATIPLRRFLRANGLESQIPLFEGDSATVRRANQESLAECDAAIVFYGAGDEAWKRTIVSEFRKIKGYRPDKAAAPVYFYLSAPETTDKKEVLELEGNAIDGLDGFSEAAMRPLLETLQQAR